jgi:hypothetical protein
MDIQAVSWKGNVSVSNIDGAFDVRAEHGSIKLQVNKLLPFTDAPQGGLHQPTQAHNSSSSSSGSGGVHAGLQSVEHAHRGKGSRATAVKGHITAVVDPEVRTSYFFVLCIAAEQRYLVFLYKQLPIP